jgi:HAD superfamily hydrolase (TIGR01509 family)
MTALVIFDCDGVLVDSEPIANRVLAETLSSAGYPCTFAESVERFVGHNLESIMIMVEAERGQELPPDFARRVQAETFEAFRRKLRPVPEIGTALDRITHPVCVASSGTIEKMTLTLGLTGLMPYFDGRLFSARSVPRGKPHPDLFLYAAHHTGVAPAACVVVEDSIPGTRAGMRVLGYAGGTHVGRDHGARLAAAGAEVFTDMAALPALIGTD